MRFLAFVHLSMSGCLFFCLSEMEFDSYWPDASSGRHVIDTWNFHSGFDLWHIGDIICIVTVNLQSLHSRFVKCCSVSMRLRSVVANKLQLYIYIFTNFTENELTICTHNFFLISIVNIWNTLPDKVVSAPSVASFRDCLVLICRIMFCIDAFFV